MSDVQTSVQIHPTAVAEERARLAAAFERWFAETFHNRALPTDLQNELSDARDRFRAALRGEET